MTNKIEKSLYNGDVKITFYPDSHRYKLEGERSYLLSVSGITGIIDKSRVLLLWATKLARNYINKFFEESKSKTFTYEELIPVIEEGLNQYNVKRDEAADIGTQVHNLAQKIGESLRDKKDLPDIPSDLDERVKNGISAFINWVVENNVKFIDCEKMLYSRTYKYVGITDAIVEINEKKYLIDYKTSKDVYPEMGYQVSGYVTAYQEEIGELDGQMIIHFNKETGEFKVVEISKEDNLINKETFLACLKIKQREKELNK